MAYFRAARDIAKPAKLSDLLNPPIATTAGLVSGNMTSKFNTYLYVLISNLTHNKAIAILLAIALEKETQNIFFCFYFLPLAKVSFHSFSAVDFFCLLINSAFHNYCFNNSAGINLSGSP